MARRHAVVRGRISGHKRSTAWTASSIPQGVNALASGATAFDQQLVSTTAFPNQETTLVRTRGNIFVQSDQVAAREEVFGALGFAVVKDPAAAVGGASLPGPLTEAQDDIWFVWEPWSAMRNADVDETPWSMNFDSKGQRKFVNGETIVVMMENSASGFGIEYEINFRMLFMLA